MNLYRVSMRFRSLVIARENMAQAQIMSRYAVAQSAIMRDLAALLAKLQAAKAKGEIAPVSWLHRASRLETLMAQAAREVDTFSRRTEPIIERSQLAAAKLGDRAAVAGAVEAGVSASWNRLPSAAINALAGNLSDGSPLRALLQTFGPQAADGASSALLKAVSQGVNPRETARTVRDELGVTLNRALTISRTETLRSFRQASTESYRANEDVVSGWTWCCSFSPRTCSACLAMHGMVHSIEEEFESHPACRCVASPLVIGREDQSMPDADEWLKSQHEETQDRILGQAKGDAYRDGRIELADMAARTEDAKWGGGIRERSLKELLGA